MSRRPTGQQPYAARAPMQEMPAPSPATLAPPFDQVEHALTRALAQGPTANPLRRAPAAVATPLPEAPAPVSSTQTALSSGAPTPKSTEHPASGPRFPLWEGTVIEAVLLNRIDGTFAGPVACLVTTPVYTQDRQRVVIPAGARVLGAAAPVQAWGEARLALTSGSPPSRRGG